MLSTFFLPTASDRGVLPGRASTAVTHLQWNDSAGLAFTDFKQQYPVTADEDTPIDEALRD